MLHLVNSLNGMIALSLWGSSSTSTSGISADLLANWAAARSKVGVNNADAGKDPNAPFAEVWSPGFTPSDAVLVQRGLTGKSFFDVNAKLYSDLGATGDYRSLFALHTGVSTLKALAKTIGSEDISKAQAVQTQKAFDRGLEELAAFFKGQEFEDMRLTQGDRFDEAQTTLAITSASEDYTTPVIHRGSISAVVSGLDPNGAFNIVAKTLGGTQKNVSIDLSQMGSIPRSLANIVSFVNNKLSAAGVSSRMATADLTPKTQSIKFGAQVVERAYTGLRQYGLKLDVRAGETVSFAPVAPDPAFYIVGANAGGARMVKLSDVSDMPGQTQFLSRPAATDDPIGAYVATGWLGAGADYQAPPPEAVENRTVAMTSLDTNTYETKLRDAGEAVLKIKLADGRTLAVSTAWRDGDLETWRVRAGETDDQGLMDDVAERLTQLLHEQGVAAGVDVWTDGDVSGLTIKTGDFVTLDSFSIGGSNVVIEEATLPNSNYVGGLREGVYARSFEAADVADAGELYKDSQSFTFTTDSGAETITIAGGTDGISASELVDKLNEKLKSNQINAAASLVDVSGKMTLRIDALHDITGVSATINEAASTLDLAAPGAWANGGLPSASAGQPFGSGVRNYTASASPLLTHTGALDISIVVATPNGNKTISVAVTAQERLDNPDASPGEWSQLFQDRLDIALNEAGVYVGATSNDLTAWSAAESVGNRISSISVNGDALTLTAADPGVLGGAFSIERSFTSAQAATGVADDVASLISDPNVSITFDTDWGPKTVSASLQLGDPRTLESAALRLNEALVAQGYDVGVAATALSGGGAGLRVVTGDSHSVRTISNVSLGGTEISASLDPIDSQSHVDDPIGALRVAERANRAASATMTNPETTYLAAPSANASSWFPGRAFDVALEGGAKAATARAVATGGDGAVYVLANLSGDSATTPIKGASDVALLKYDSAGKLLFSRILGASEDASGFALAVAADGKVAIAGSVDGGLRGAEGKSGGVDSLVALYDANGVEQWVSRRGATGTDEATAVAFAPDGSVIVTGRTESALGANIALGRADAYVRGFSTGGLELFSKQFGTGGEDTATALLVRDNGVGGISITTGGVENDHGVLRSFTYSSGAGFSAGAVRDIGNFTKGAVTSLVADGTSLYVAGTVGGERVTLGQSVRESIAGKEGFVSRLNIDLTSNGLDRTTYIGSSGDDSVASIALVNGEIYATGVSGGIIAGQGTAGKNGAFIARLGDGGDIAWARTFSTIGGAIAPLAMAVDTQGASVLDILGMPTGTIGASNSTLLVNRSALRVGDEFKIAIDDRHGATISILAKDTMSSLLGRINRALGGGGRAQLIKEDGAERIKITATEGHAVQIGSGREGRDALGGLGLKPGVVAIKPSSKGALRTFGLGLLAADLKLDSKEAIAKTISELSAATSIIRQAYEAIVNPNAKELTPEEKALEARRQAGSSAAKAIYSAQIANYQAAISRLGGY
jgi:hypothetical protein